MTKRWRAFKIVVIVIFTVSPAINAPVAPQNAGGGDQFLDGIGETALIARYLFNGSAEDRSRNNFHATLRGDAAGFVQDSRFGSILHLPGNGSYVQLPGNALKGEDAISVTGWIFLNSDAPGQRFLDFGQDVSSSLSAAVTGAEPGAGFRAAIVSGAAHSETNPVQVPLNQWAHLAIVLDPANRTLTTFLNGARVGQATDVGASVTRVLNQASAEANRLFIGRSQSDANPTLHANVRDIRIYRVALTDQQVAAIYSSRPAGGARKGRVPPPPPPALDSVLPTASPLVAVPDVKVDTVAGQLPRLPYKVAAVYANKAKGPDVRVVWPAPKDNSQVLKPGVYSVTGRVPGTSFQAKATVTVKAATGATPVPKRLVESFLLGQVVLDRDTKQRDTQFIKNRDKFIRGLAATNPDRFLYNFRDAFGQKQPEGTAPLGGWDSQTTRLRGHATGHYLSAIAQAYASATYDESLRANFLRKMNYLIDILYDLSRKSGRPAHEGGPSNPDPTAVPPGPGRTAYDSNLRADAIRTDYWNWGRGFISAYPPDQFIMLEQGATYGGQNSQIWAPYYTLHKILAGLMDGYEVGGNQKALEIAKDMGVWAYARLKVVPADTRISMWNRYIAGEYGGMNEVMARLYRLTGDRQFLECARLFDNINFFFGDAERDHGLARNVDTIRGRHANQHIPQITGALETFRDTGEIPYYQIAANFWNMATNSYMYSIGGVAGARNPNNAECFTAEPDTLFENGFSSGGQNETCATYNLLKLDRQLFMFAGAARYMDHYERGLYNHILASVAEDSAANTYHVPLNPGARKQFDNADMSGFSCCNGTALESNTKLQDSIYFRSVDGQTLYVNLFIPSTLNWAERQLVVKQLTDFPYSDTTRLVLRGSGRFDIGIRVPHWANRGFFVKINGRQQRVKAVPGTYLTLHRTWRDNDTIEVRMPLHFYLDPIMDRPNLASLFYGPILMAAEESAPRTDWRPVTLDSTDIGKSIVGDPSTLRFSISGVVFKPFYETYTRYSVYLAVTLK